MNGFRRELQRRGVLRIGALYAAAAWLIVQVADALVPVFDLPPASVRWIVIGLAVGFVPALALAWAFEWTPAGLRRESDQTVDTPARAAHSRKLDRVVIVVLALAVAWFALDEFLLEPADAPAPSADRRVSIAVLPFADLSEARDQEYLADGISEELLNLLARIPQLDVASRTSAFAFKGKNLPVAEIAKVLNVSHVLEGSVRKSGELLRITVQLIDAATGYHVLSEVFEQPEGDIFRIQDEIARGTVDSLELQLLGGLPRAEETDPRAYVLYLRAVHRERQASAESMAEAVALFQEALAIDPGYATAWVGLSAVYGNQADAGLRPQAEAYSLARQAALEALRIDPENAAAYDRLCWIARVHDANLAAAADHCTRALALEPTNDLIIGNAAVLMQSLGRLDEAIALHEYTVARAPTDTRGLHNLALAYYFDDRLPEAEATIRKVLALSPDYYSASYRLGTILLLQGRVDEARDAFAREPDEEFRVKGRALAASALGEEAEARAALAELETRWGEEWPSEVAHVYAFRGELDEAFRWLEKDYEVAGAAGWGEWRLMRHWDNLRDDPRWQAFLHKVGVSDEQLAAISFEVRVPEAGR